MWATRLLGPDRLSAAVQVGISNPIPKASVQAWGEIGLVAVASKVETGVRVVTSVPISHAGSGVYQPIITTVTPKTLGAAVGNFVSVVGAGKNVFDAGVYIGALVVCTK